MTNFVLEFGSLLHLGNCHLCKSTQKWLENSGCSVRCAMLLFYLRGLTQLRLTLKGSGICKSPSRVLAIEDSLEGLSGHLAGAWSAWPALGAVKFTWAFHRLCWLLKYFQDQVTGLRRNLSNSNREMGNAQAVRQWQVGDVNVNFGVYFAASTLLISSASKSGKI